MNHTLPKCLLGLALCFLPLAAAFAQTVTVTIAADRPANSFVAGRAFGAGVDGLERGAVAQVYTPANLRAMGGAGYGALTYRLRTELGIEAWHWDPRGQWSDPAHGRGYWTSTTDGPTGADGSGYRLPRRGSTVDQAGNDGYSRLDDGDPRTFWKSNPYLDRHFTGEDNVRHPQWVVVNLGKSEPVNAVRIRWAVPYATRYRVDYWQGTEDGDADSLDDTYGQGQWRPFPSGAVQSGRGGNVLLRLALRRVRYVRLWMTESSDTPPPGATDVRDGLGYAISEVGVGRVDRAGRFHDWVRRGKGRRTQTAMFASSTDPWHTSDDKDPDTEQPGFGRVFGSGLTHGLPLLAPVGLLYDTPDNAAAEARFWRRRGFPVRQVEMGEEPDGQYATPEDYGALYIQFADALHRADPAQRLGGPSFQTDINGWRAWPDAGGDRSWMRRFLRYLKARGRLDELTFCSFEWYPFDDVTAPAGPQLRAEPGLLTAAVARLRREGLPATVPLYLTEYGYSAFAGRAEMDMPGALLNADIVGQFLTLGGARAYLYGLEPNSPIQEVPGPDAWGNLALFLSDAGRHIRCPLATFYGLRLLTQEWAQPGTERPQTVYPARADDPAVTAYAVRRPDGRWAVLLVNKDPHRAHTVRLRFRAGTTLFPWRGPTDILQYSSAQYIWHPRGANGYPAPDLPPAHAVTSSSILRLPPYSLTVVRGHLGPG